MLIKFHNNIPFQKSTLSKLFAGELFLNQGLEKIKKHDLIVELFIYAPWIKKISYLYYPTFLVYIIFLPTAK